MQISVITKVMQQVSELVLFDDPNAALLANDNPTYIAKVKSLPQNGDANKEIIELISKEFKVPKSSTRLVSGAKSSRKIFEF